MLPETLLPPAVSGANPLLAPFSTPHADPMQGLASRLERVASSLRGSNPEQLLAHGRASGDPLLLLIAGFALGHADGQAR